MTTVQDARGRSLTLKNRPDRIVSLVPSVTESVALIAGPRRLLGITKFCTEPRADVPAIRKIGGTKDPDVAAIVSLQPDIVLANREENRREDIEALEAAGLPVFVGYPRGVQESLDELRTIGTLLHAAGLPRPFKEIETELARQVALNADRPRVRVFCPIWRKPYMAVGGDTYAGDVIRMAGGDNVFESHPRGNRYPQVDLAEIAAADPEVILLPDEPYRFRTRHREEILALRSMTAAREGHVFLLDGRWLSWYGPRAAEGLAGLEALLDQARSDWQPPARPPIKPPARARKDPAKAAQKTSSPSAGAAPAQPQRTPQVQAPMPPGLKLRVRSQEVVEE